jgi:surface antigen
LIGVTAAGTGALTDTTCHPYTQPVTIGGVTTQASAYLCRQGDAMWRVVQPTFPAAGPSRD